MWKREGSLKGFWYYSLSAMDSSLLCRWIVTTQFCSPYLRTLKSIKTMSIHFPPREAFLFSLAYQASLPSALIYFSPLHPQLPSQIRCLYG